MNYLQRNIFLLYLIKIAKWFMLTMPILMLFYKEMGFSAQESFWLKAAYSIAIVVFELPSGVIADRWGKKRSLQIGAVLGTAGFVIYSLMDGFYAFLAAELVLGLGMSFISGADSAMIYDTLRAHSREKEYIRYESRNFSIGNFAEALAGLAGGALAAMELRYPFYAQTGIAFLAIPAAWSLIEPHLPNSKVPTRFSVSQLVQQTLVQNKSLRYNLIFSSILGSVTLAMAWIYPLRLNELGYSIIDVGIGHTVLNLILGFTTLWAYRIEQKLKPKATILLTTVGLMGTFILSGIANPYWIPLILVLFYIARAVASPVLKDYVLQVTPPEIRATVLSLRSLLIRGIFSLLGPFFGFCTDQYNMQTAIILSGWILGAITLIFILLFLRSLKTTTSTYNLTNQNHLQG